MQNSEQSRLLAMSQYENQLKAKGFQRIAGIDEAGRGPLAGPVVAAACILPVGSSLEKLNDSKQVSPKVREILFEQIISSSIYGIGIVDVETIDRINILQATFLAMKKAMEALSIEPDYLLIDGSQAPHFPIPNMTIVKGDTLSVSIAAASILAKVTRDRIVDSYQKNWPQYKFEKHKGYATAEHMNAIRQHGPCQVHRKTFEPIKSMLTRFAIQEELFPL